MTAGARSRWPPSPGSIPTSFGAPPASAPQRRCARAHRSRSCRSSRLAAALALPPGLAADVALTAAAYQPHVEADGAAADRAVARLVEACGGVPDEVTAVRISLLVQASAATAALLAGAQRRDDRSSPLEELLGETLRCDPPVPATRRVAIRPARIGAGEVAAGTILTLDLTAGHDAALQFGAGLRPCPGREQALALAAGALEALRALCA